MGLGAVHACARPWNLDAILSVAGGPAILPGRHPMSDSTRHSRPVWVERFTDEPSNRVSRFVVHEHAALLYVMDGQLVHEQRGRFELEAGDVLLIPAGEAHRAFRTARTTAWGVGFCAPCYAPSELANLLDPFERARSGASPIVHLAAERHDYVKRLIAELHAETRADRAHCELVHKSLLALLLAEVTRATSLDPTSQPSFVADALRFIERRCLESISLSDVARAVGRSPSYVTTALKQATGKSVVEWIITGRLSEARNRLLHTDEKVEIVAERVGYADATHFIRLFRRAHGCTPAAWRTERRPIKRSFTPKR